eukprot:TRINITY_DN2684_c0_g1_i2.p1 TRINITY_DN2684_c0_g1~~TRINITY_DN2684_c0_g1_i2.p1  ORF type:complete len:182 (+),score=52.84 TRINITY_DN2684_c0_g1_i2:374-919(+)
MKEMNLSSNIPFDEFTQLFPKISKSLLKDLYCKIKDVENVDKPMNTNLEDEDDLSPPSTPTPSPTLPVYELSPQEDENYNRALLAVLSEKNISLKRFQEKTQLSDIVARSLLERLENEGYILRPTKTSRGVRKVVQNERRKEVLEKLKNQERSKENNDQNQNHNHSGNKNSSNSKKEENEV